MNQRTDRRRKQFAQPENLVGGCLLYRFPATAVKPQIIELRPLPQTTTDATIEPDSFRRQLAWIAQDRGYRPGWINRCTFERFGQWPEGPLPGPPYPPSAATLRWVSNKHRAFVKSQRPEPATTTERSTIRPERRD